MVAGRAGRIDPAGPSASVVKEGGMDAIDHRTHVNEVHGSIGVRR
jgi:hypothetical protein